MNTDTDSTSLICPCCSEYIYDLYKCTNSHYLCGNCFMRVKQCPICRDEKIKDANNQLHELTKSILRKHCKNHDKGCNASLYSFDDDHETFCFCNSFKCKFCSLIFEDNCSTNDVIQHYQNNCVNEYQILTYPMPDHEETVGHSFKIQNIENIPTLITIIDHYHIMLIPKKSDNLMNIMIFSSTGNKYKRSNYKVSIFNSSNELALNSHIVYKQFENKPVTLSQFVVDNSGNSRKISLCIQNKFLLKPKITKCKIDDVTYVESHYVAGEPDSPGNWTKESYDEMTKEFMNLFSNNRK